MDLCSNTFRSAQQNFCAMPILGSRVHFLWVELFLIVPGPHWTEEAQATRLSPDVTCNSVHMLHFGQPMPVLGSPLQKLKS